MAVGVCKHRWQYHGQVAVVLATILTLLIGCGRGETSPQRVPTENAEWDIVVLGRIDMCGGCRRGSPQLVYVKVLVGDPPAAELRGTLAIVGIPTSVLPSGAFRCMQARKTKSCFSRESKTRICTWCSRAASDAREPGAVRPPMTHAAIPCGRPNHCFPISRRAR